MFVKNNHKKFVDYLKIIAILYIEGLKARRKNYLILGGILWQNKIKNLILGHCY